MRTAAVLLLFSLSLIQSCTPTAVNLEPTIDNLPVHKEAYIDIEPQDNFELEDDELIKSYRELVSITPQSDSYGKEVQRLADLELEVSMDNKLSDNPGLVKQGEQEAELAIQRYKKYLQTYPDRPDNDLILYQLSRAYAMDSKAEEAQAYMDQLVTQFPDSFYMDEVQFRRGENFFVDGAYVDAEKAYGVVVSGYPNSLYYEKSLFKYGWTQFKQQRFRKAIDSYIKLLDLKQQQQDLDGFHLAKFLTRAEKEFIEDVLRVTSLSFSYLPARQPISQYFNSAGKRSYAPLLYRTLAELYLKKERLTDAADVYLAYTENYPFSRYTPIFHGQAIDTYKKAGFVSMLLPAKQTYVEKYNKGSAFWDQQLAETQASLQPVLTAHIFDIATHYHATAGVSKKAADYKNTANWYQLYLKSFPQDNKAAEVNFLLAESRFDAGQYEQAITEYEKTAYQYPKHKSSAEAGYAALIAYNKLSDSIDKKKRPLVNDKVNDKLIQSSLRFSDQFPKDKRMPSVLIKTAEQFFDLKKYTQAQTTAESLLNNADIEPAIKHRGWILIAHSNFELANYSAAEKAYMQVLSGLSGKSKKQLKNKQTMQEQLALSIYKQGEAERTAGYHQQAALHFQRVGKTVPSSPKKIVADYDAATEYMTLKQWPTAIELLEAFRQSYPRQKKWAQGVSQKLTLAYSNLSKPAKAAGEMMTLVKLTPKNQQQDLLWQAAELYKQAGDEKKAISIYKTYIKKYPKPIARSIELRYKIARYYEQQKDTKRHHFWLKEIVKADARGKKQRTDRTRYLAAISSLQLIAPLHKKYSSAKLTRPLKKSLKVKKKLMKQSIAAYTKAAKYQVEEVTTTVTFNIAEIYRQFANALLTSERPQKLNEEALEEYNYLLEDQAYPFEEKAINIYESNLTRIAQGSFDDAIKNSLKALAILMPFRYAKSELTDSHAN